MGSSKLSNKRGGMAGNYLPLGIKSPGRRSYARDRFVLLKLG